MRRARNPPPFEIKGISFAPKTGRYVISESGITYKLTLDHTRLLKAYFRYNLFGHQSIAIWFKDLDRITKCEVIREGVAEEKDDFYPDTS